jgi:hypothetical protein
MFHMGQLSFNVACDTCHSCNHIWNHAKGGIKVIFLLHFIKFVEVVVVHIPRCSRVVHRLHLLEEHLAVVGIVEIGSLCLINLECIVAWCLLIIILGRIPVHIGRQMHMWNRLIIELFRGWWLHMEVCQTADNVQFNVVVHIIFISRDPYHLGASFSIKALLHTRSVIHKYAMVLQLDW